MSGYLPVSKHLLKEFAKYQAIRNLASLIVVAGISIAPGDLLPFREAIISCSLVG